jgi:hypothetical protein
MSLNKIQSTAVFLALLFALLLSAGESAEAQSALFNVPTTDVMPTGETYLEADFDSHLSGYESGGYQSYGGAALYGARRRMEVGLNVYYVRLGGSAHSAELQPNVKWQVYASEDSGVAAAVGAILYVPAGGRPLGDTFGNVYATASKKLRGRFGPRLTGGGYALVGRGRGAGDAGGALFGYEQPVHPRLSLIADWNTGRNRFGYAAAGLGLALPGRSFLYAGYYFGNEGRGNNSLGVYYGVSF